MLRRRLLLALPVVALGATAALVVPGGAASAAPPPTTQGKTYVALGDSYAAGFGLPASQGTLTGQPVPGCAQTDGDYPHLLAAQLGLTLTDVTCSGATTADFSSPQTAAGAPAQLDVFKTVQPDLVTITIGGNDLGFSAITATCLAQTKNGPTFLTGAQTCKAYYTGPGAAQNPYTKLAGVLAKVDAAIKAVKAAAPNAKIAVIAYPAITPDTANTPRVGCYTSEAVTPPIPLPGLPISVGSTLPFTDTDVPFLQVLQQQLDAGIGTTAAANGAAYADIYPSSLAHSACEPEASRWVEPLIPSGGGTNSVHPNLAGTTAMADTLAPVVEALFAPPTTTTPTVGSSGPVSSTSSAPSSSSATEPLADTGVRWPVGWLLGVAAVLLVAGAASVRMARPYRGRH